MQGLREGGIHGEEDIKDFAIKHEYKIQLVSDLLVLGKKNISPHMIFSAFLFVKVNKVFVSY